MHAGDFGNFQLSFLSADIERRVVDHMQTLMSGNMASLMQLTRSTHRQVVPFLKTACVTSLSSHCGGMQLLQVQPLCANCADASSGLQLAGVIAAAIFEAWTHGILQEGRCLRTRCGADCSDVLQESVGA